MCNTLLKLHYTLLKLHYTGMKLGTWKKCNNSLCNIRSVDVRIGRVIIELGNVHFDQQPYVMALFLFFALNFCWFLEHNGLVAEMLLYSLGLVEGLLGPLREPVARITCQAALWNLLLLGSLFRSLRSLFAQKRHGGKEDGLMDTRDAELLHLMESFLEAAPQLVLQLSIIIMENSANEVQVLCVVLSLFSLALSIKSYLHALREANYHLPPPQHQHKLSCKGQAMMLLWRLGMISSRGVAMAIFFTGYGAWLLLVVGIHWAVMFVCHLHQKTTFTFPENLTYEMLNGQRGKWKILLKEWFYDFVMAGVTVFCFMNLQPGRSRGRMTFYYSIMFIENSVMAVVWCLSTDPDDRSWDTYLLLTLVWGSFVFGLIWLALYYQYGHPNKQDYQLNAVERFIHHALFVLQKDVLIRDAKLDSAMRETEV